jgi:hypothetical protein
VRFYERAPAPLDCSPCNCRYDDIQDVVGVTTFIIGHAGPMQLEKKLFTYQSIRRQSPLIAWESTLTRFLFLITLQSSHQIHKQERSISRSWSFGIRPPQCNSKIAANATLERSRCPIALLSDASAIIKARRFGSYHKLAPCKLSGEVYNAGDAVGNIPHFGLSFYLKIQ